MHHDANSNSTAGGLDAEFLFKYNRPGPRYTSYPPAPHFHSDFQMGDWRDLIDASDKAGDSISFYAHIPFCPHRCLYCGCNTEIAAKGDLVRDYQAALLTEIGRNRELLSSQRKVSQIHFGGGTPNSVPYTLLGEVLEALTKRHRLKPRAEVAIECDPNFLTPLALKRLRELGFNRISLGLQDFHTEILDLVERRFPRTAPAELIAAARDLGFRGINLDLIYGLPGQTPENFAETLRRTVEAGPDRVAVFSYAHVPKVKPHQQDLEDLGLPPPHTKIRMLIETHEILQGAGYRAIGMDHFARPDDELGVALETGNLRRNFQGYCTGETTGQVYAFGASAISQLNNGFAQNHRDTRKYVEAVNEGAVPVEKLYRSSPADLFYRDVIEGLMCRGNLDLEALESRWHLENGSLDAKLEAGLGASRQFQEDGLVTWRGRRMTVTARGWLVVRCIAMAFDPLISDRPTAYSSTV